MNFNSIDEIKSSGFTGFKKISELSIDIKSIPHERGIYFVLNMDKVDPKFIVPGVGGFFKGRDPNISVSELEQNWVENSLVVYIGQAGGIINGKWSDSTLQKRIKQYLRFGQGENVGHYGGRLIWQLGNYRDLELCWKSLAGRVMDPKEEESRLISAFKTQFGKRPFANLQD